MRLDIKYQPLNFDIYLSQEIDVPRTSLEEKPYDFQREVDALKTVDTLLERIHNGTQKKKVFELKEPFTSTSVPLTPSTISAPSCPTETLLTPIKSSPTEIHSTPSTQSNGQTANQVNPRDFEDIHYNPFDHLELQTIDELRELDLVFQASYAAEKPKEQK